MEIKPHFIIGLGNPGSQYDSTYHNAGWLALDFLIQSSRSKIESLKFKKYGSFQYLKTEDYIFIKPQTFMNESGKAVLAAMKYFSAKNRKIKPGEILVIHDDSDIELGKLKLSFGQRAAGHHGVESIIKNLKTKDFWRIRIGIRPKASRKKTGLLAETDRAKASEFVLKKTTPADKLILEQLFKADLSL